MDAYGSQTLMQLACAARVMQDAPSFVYADNAGIQLCGEDQLKAMCPQGNRLYGKRLSGQRSIHCFQQFGVRFYVPTFHRKNPEFVNVSPENRRIHLTTSPDDSIPSAPSTPIPNELLTKLYRGDEI